MTDYHQRRSGLIVPGDKRPTCIDLFAGCGGFSLGMIQGGFEVVAAVDNDVPSLETYLCNLGSYPVSVHYATPEDKKRLKDDFEKSYKKKNGKIVTMSVSGSGWISSEPDIPPVRHFFFGDIRKFTGKQILDAIGMKVGEVDCVVGGPPCQGFSTSGKRNVMDPRNSLVFEFARMVLEIRPKTMCMENVPGILNMVTPEGIPVVDALCRILEDGDFGTMNALKKSLLASAGVGAAVRTKKRDKRPKTQTKQEALAI